MDKIGFRCSVVRRLALTRLSLILGKRNGGLNGLRGNGALQVLRGDQLKLKLMGEIRFLFVSQIYSPNILSYLPYPGEASYKGGNCRQVRNHLGNRYIVFVEG